TEKIIALGASTGGTEALKEVLLGLPAHSPGVVITQHMPPGFTRSFAERLDRLTRLSVSEARDGDRILPGHALVAPGDHHMEVQRSGANYVVRLNRQAQVNGHRPAVDVMFESLARCAGRNLLAGLLTGMGKDGARGLLAIRQAGGYTLAQDEATCVVYGMPREAVELGAAEDVLPLERIAAALLQQAARRGSGNRL
ncbi:chemotaxis protein CheB, partial [Pseudomonas aeruginosa]|nr:chemotaxis protein CheB [Pseudomonas aeruginosa]MDG3657072.1 CheB methylesterase domain-containing protein [Pseudomonas aeruginosa]MDG3738637.1 CheB methylesterase domain-containing protein [Pseudomonas aeruginosa]